MLLLDLGKHWVAIKLSTRVIITPNGVSILDQMLAQLLSEGTINQVRKYVFDIFFDHFFEEKETYKYGFKKIFFDKHFRITQIAH